MDKALKKKLRLSYQGWHRTCLHCNGQKKEAYHKAYREAITEAVVYTNTLHLPESFGQLRVNEGFGSEFDIAHWTVRDNQGVMKGDDYDGGSLAWYWRVPHGGPEKLRWKPSPPASLIDLVEYLERKYGSPPIGLGSATCPPLQAESLHSI